MEFASEMVIKASLRQLRIAEVPVTLSPDGRSRPPHLRSWRDGWRHPRFPLLFSPRWLFFLPRGILFLLRLGGGASGEGGPVPLRGPAFSLDTPVSGRHRGWEALYEGLSVVFD